MEKLPKAEYSAEFRKQAVRTYQESGLSVAEIAKRLSVPKSSLNADLIPQAGQNHAPNFSCQIESYLGKASAYSSNAKRIPQSPHPPARSPHQYRRWFTKELLFLAILAGAAAQLGV